ncbi:Asp-tRNA(Asn)/Glu-tRNA(Gln) amidotransferase subunit GatA [Beduini massiliensis]|uniref:Asp-tRNA(Asn)/Glu-tRNA(Gln) amidotransferase subunit GatA n=1 Tax=Beduini massiliensis TaxID=1585974 RepID=UPI00059A9E77|nr:Asp-tRNA(Asn)/Glu-tRNA(Gln) amidotransferase subunit GatA [Beduini massiliensis]
MYGLTITQLHDMLKNKEIDIKTYYEQLFSDTNEVQQRLNAFVTITKEEALAKLDHFQFDENNWLSGIPFVAKDNYSTKGIKTTASSRMLEHYVPIYNAHVIDKLAKKDCIMIGKSSMDELAMGGTNKSALTGPVGNPYDATRIAGGSSGGSAAIVGSGLVPFALGSDTGDSIRKPAGYCGVIGFKPTWGRISRYGVIPYASSLDHVGAFTRSVEDMAIVIEAMSGRDERDMTSSNRPVEAYYDHLTSDIQDKKIAVIQNIYDQISNSEIKENFDHIIDLYKKMGCTVDFVEYDETLLKAMLPTYTIIANSEATSNHACLDGVKYGTRVDAATPDEVMIASRTNGFGAHIKRRFILGNLALATQNQEKMFRKAQRVRRLIVEELNKIYENYDVILGPTAGHVAAKIEEEETDRLTDEYLILENHLVLGNFAGTPSLTLPCGFVDEMPIGINIMGKLFEEQTVLNAAYALEKELGLKNKYAKGEA